MKIFFLAMVVLSARAYGADVPSRYCQLTMKSAASSSLLSDLDGILLITENGVDVERTKFSMMKRVQLEKDGDTLTITRDDGGHGSETVRIEKLSDDPLAFEIEDRDRTAALSNFFRTSRIRLQFVGNTCIPTEVKTAKGSEPKSWLTEFELNDCLRTKGRSKNCQIQVAGLLDDPRAKKAAEQTRLTEVIPSGTGAVH